MRRAHRDGRAAGPQPVPARDRRAAPDVGVLRGEQGGVRGVRADRRRSSRRSRSTRPSSRSVGCARVSGTPREIAAQLRREVLERVGLPITVGVARTKFLAKVASGVAKPDGLLVVPPDGELAVPAPAPGRAACGASGPVTADKLNREGDHDRRRGRGARRGRRSSRCSVGLRAGTSTRWPTTAIPGRCRRAGAGARSARSTRSAGGLAASRTSTPCSSGSSTGSPAGCARPRRVGRTVVLRLRFDDFSRADAIAHARAGDRADRPDPRDGARPAEHRHPDDRAPGPHPRRRLGRHARRRRGAARVAVRLGATRACLDAALDGVRDRFGSASVTRAVLLGRDQGVVGTDASRLTAA